MVPAQTSEAMRYVKVPLVAGSRFKMFGVRCFRAPNTTVTIFIKVFGKSRGNFIYFFAEFQNSDNTCPSSFE